MHVVGDPDGVAALKAIAQEHREYIKFLIGEAQSSTDHVAVFRGADGTRWEIHFHLQSGEFEVRRARAGSPPTSPPPTTSSS